MFLPSPPLFPFLLLPFFFTRWPSLFLFLSSNSLLILSTRPGSVPDCGSSICVHHDCDSPLVVGVLLKHDGDPVPLPADPSILLGLGPVLVLEHEVVPGGVLLGLDLSDPGVP